MIRKKVGFLFFLLLPLAVSGLRPAKAVFWAEKPHAGHVDSIYRVLDSLNTVLPSQLALQKALNGLNIHVFEKPILSVIDFTLPSTEKRLWVIDLQTGKVLHHTLVAHGKNSGDLYAKRFSNVPESNQSSLGFYTTGSSYNGKHGLSLKLHGLERGVNDMAEPRAIVIHGADYVSEAFIKKNGRLGRSFGCPAIPKDLNEEIIKTIRQGSCLYIHYSD